MYEILTTKTYNDWFNSLKDIQGKARINVRLRRIQLGNFGDAELIGNNISELRFFFDPGYRIYFMQQGNHLTCWW